MEGDSRLILSLVGPSHELPRHKKQIAKVKLKQRAKAKVQRGVAAIPILGIGSLAAFEALEFKEWQKGIITKYWVLTKTPVLPNSKKPIAAWR